MRLHSELTTQKEGETRANVLIGALYCPCNCRSCDLLSQRLVLECSYFSLSVFPSILLLLIIQTIKKRERKKNMNITTDFTNDTVLKYFKLFLGKYPLWSKILQYSFKYAIELRIVAVMKHKQLHKNSNFNRFIFERI